MKAIVCVKQVPDTQGKVAVKADGTMDRAAMATITNPDDLNAVEAALQLKDETGCEVVVVTMGPPPAEGMLRELMARGADRGVLVSGREFGGSDTFATSQILAAARQLQDSELGEIPVMSDTPAMVFTLKAGKTTRTLTVDQLNDVAGVYYVYDDAGGVYTVAKSDLNNLCKAPRSLYAAQSLTDKTSDDVTALTVGDLQFVLNDGTWQLADDADYALDQSAVKRMVSTLCEMQTEWSITTPEADSAYGLDAPDVTAVLAFSDGTQLTVRFGDLVPEAADDTDTGSTTTTSLCYLASDGAPGIVYEVKAAHKDAFAVTKESLLDTSTKETAAADDVVAEH